MSSKEIRGDEFGDDLSWAGLMTETKSFSIAPQKASYRTLLCEPWYTYSITFKGYDDRTKLLVCI